MHQGATKLRQRSRLSLYWPGIDRDATEAAQSCPSCVEKMPSNPQEPLRAHEPASRPFEQVHADFATVNGRYFLVIVDQFSGWPHVHSFPGTGATARQLMDAVRNFFHRWSGGRNKVLERQWTSVHVCRIQVIFSRLGSRAWYFIPTLPSVKWAR